MSEIEIDSQNCLKKSLRSYYVFICRFYETYTYNRWLLVIDITIKVVECRSKGQLKVYATAFHQHEACTVKFIYCYRENMIGVMSIHVLSTFLTNINELSKLTSAEFLRPNILCVIKGAPTIDQIELVV